MECYSRLSFEMLEEFTELQCNRVRADTEAGQCFEHID